MNFPIMGAQPVALSSTDEKALTANQPPPDRQLSSTALQKKIPALRDARNYELAIALGCPPPTKHGFDGWTSIIPRSDSWSELAVDRWLESLREKRRQLAIFIG